VREGHWNPVPGPAAEVEESVEGVEIVRGDRVVLVIVADGAAGGQPHPGLGRGTCAIDGVAEVPLRLDRAPLAGRHIAAVEARGDPLIDRRVGDQVASELVDREAIKGNVSR